MSESEEIKPIDHTLAAIVMDQCIGTRNGEMAPIHYNPVIASIFAILMAPDRGHPKYMDQKQAFAKALKSIAAALDHDGIVDPDEIPF